MYFLSGTKFEQVQGLIQKLLKLEKEAILKLHLLTAWFNFEDAPHVSSAIDSILNCNTDTNELLWLSGCTSLL